MYYYFFVLVGQIFLVYSFYLTKSQEYGIFSYKIEARIIRAFVLWSCP